MRNWLRRLSANLLPLGPRRDCAAPALLPQSQVPLQAARAYRKPVCGVLHQGLLRAASPQALHRLRSADGSAQAWRSSQRRESALKFIDEILERRPLATFSATHLELLELLFAYWRETEVAEDAPMRASMPDPIQ